MRGPRVSLQKVASLPPTLATAKVARAASQSAEAASQYDYTNPVFDLPFDVDDDLFDPETLDERKRRVQRLMTQSKRSTEETVAQAIEGGTEEVKHKAEVVTQLMGIPSERFWDLVEAHRHSHEGVDKLVKRMKLLGKDYKGLEDDAKVITSNCIRCLRYNPGKKFRHLPGFITANGPMLHTGRPHLTQHDWCRWIQVHPCVRMQSHRLCRPTFPCIQDS
jgi:hypothetical protein